MASFTGALIKNAAPKTLGADVRDPSSINVSAGSSGGATFTPQAFDSGKLKAFQQEALAPGVSQIRRQIREIQAGRFSSPTARAEALRAAVRGGGEALAPLQASAAQMAMARFLPEFEQKVLMEKLRFAEEQRQSEEEEAQIAEVVAGYTPGPFDPAGASANRERIANALGGGGPLTKVTGLTEASRRPITDAVSEPSLLEETASGGTSLGFNPNWATI
jgi:hypothetical protein